MLFRVCFQPPDEKKTAPAERESCSLIAGMAELVCAG